MVLSEFMKSYLNGTLGLIDAVVTFSSVEHSGLGRYGDILNPWEDIIAIARAWCVTKNNGRKTYSLLAMNSCLVFKLFFTEVTDFLCLILIEIEMKRRRRVYIFCRI